MGEIKEIISVQKLKVTIVAETEEEKRAKHKTIRDEMYNQYCALNLAMSLYATHNTLEKYNSGAENRLNGQIKKIQTNIDKQDAIINSPKSTQAKIDKAIVLKKELLGQINAFKEEYDVKKSIRTDIDIKFNEMYVKDIYQVLINEFNFITTNTPNCVTQKVKSDFKTIIKNGYANGERSLTSYKRNFPLMIKGNADSCYDDGSFKSLDFYYNGEDVLIRWTNGIVFKVVQGSKMKNIDFKHTLHKFVTGEYRVGQSSLQFDKNNHLIMNVNFRYKKQMNDDFVDGRTLGVDVGMAIPAYCCLSDDTFIRKGFGCADEFVKVREQMKQRRIRLQKQLALVKGGKGRKKKLGAMDQFKEKERNFVKTYNHQLSSKVVKFAKENKCQYINLEKITKNGFDDRLLSVWSYYELQQMIKYKAERENIIVRFINPAYTSQKCSKCGHTHEDNRKTQAQFECVECGFKLNADHNASINIARSTEFVD